MDRPAAGRILDYMEQRIARSANPRVFGKALSGSTGLWRYRVGSYRVICQIREEKCLILAVRIGHRKEIYRNVIRRLGGVAGVPRPQPPGQ
ncbi:MAG: mRNA interferase RelE/StbE [Candidatus Kentron sp. G]|nr:MAG: mRNA interferase RelE/StbE [Candidatus Kentron sp. G]